MYHLIKSNTDEITEMFVEINFDEILDAEDDRVGVNDQLEARG